MVGRHLGGRTHEDIMNLYSPSPLDICRLTDEVHEALQAENHELLHLKLSELCECVRAYRASLR